MTKQTTGQVGLVAQLPTPKKGGCREWHSSDRRLQRRDAPTHGVLSPRGGPANDGRTAQPCKDTAVCRRPHVLTLTRNKPFLLHPNNGYDMVAAAGSVHNTKSASNRSR